MASTWRSSFILALALLFAAGCGGKKALQTVETPAPEVTATQPVAQPERTEKAAPETAKKETAAPILEMVYFDFDKYNLTPAAREILAVNAQALKQNSGMEVVIEGHCDERGTVEYNLALGDKRAKAVKDYLVWLGVDGSRLTTVSYGKERPVDLRHNEEAWARNRRAEFVIKTQPTFSDSY
jgi:peptidoglycan-associated lipoprotein